MSVGRLIGRGNTAEVYEWGDKGEKVIKLFYEKVPFDIIKREYETSSVINQLGIPSPGLGDLIEYNQKWGIICEKITGIGFTQQISTRPFSLKKNAALFAELQASYHNISTNKLPEQKEYLTRNILGTTLLTDIEKEEILKYLKILPVDNKVCHGDYHTENIILNDQKPKILDWMTGASGNSCGDVARTFLIIRYSILPPDMPKVTKFIIQSVRKVFAKVYLIAYTKTTNTSVKSIDEWMLPVMAARLVEGVPNQEKQFLLDKIRRELQSRN
ncbi:phosphotransferase [Neobacillus terrae]|uniref:phosphotransferase n=1 Tax=Neobacillus terrae TaxID=3034837 RepID=UPI001407FF01|nr:phosphotransferase [Neobacillus terrae]NHM30933.1 phosphotransferase [Neobacillus terrae]